MMKRKKVLNFVLLVVILLVISFVVYQSMDDKEAVPVQNPLQEPEEVLTIEEEQPENLTLRDSIVEYSLDLLGTPYVTAGSDRNGFDCSGFVYYVYEHFGIEVPRSTANFENFGEEIPLAEAKKGDLLLFLSPTRNAIGHIGIITEAKGKESDFIHATSGRAMSVVVTSLLNEGYTRRFVKAVRVI